MITASRLRSCDSRDSLFALLRELGYPVQPVTVAPSEWRGAGIDHRYAFASSPAGPPIASKAARKSSADRSCPTEM